MKPPKLEQDREFVLSKKEGLGRHARDFDWFETNVPCQAACPAGTDIPGYLEAITDGDFARAYRINLESNVFPAVLGRVCTRPCEPACRHGFPGLGDPVAICWSKRAADDHMLAGPPVALEPMFLPSGKSVGVIGGGAAGLAAARELARWGHDVTVYEQHGEPGGMMIQGIPEFRLPRDVVRQEVEQVRLAGVTFQCDTAIGVDVGLEEVRAGHDAVVIAAGTFRPNVPDIPGVDLPHVRHGVAFLSEVNAGAEPDVGDQVVVIGGGFTAVDCVRIARRLGAAEVTMLYRRRMDDSYIPSEEFALLPDEGIDVQFCVVPEAFTENGLRVLRTQVVDGKAEPVAGSEFEMAADLVLLGTGQAPNVDWLDEAMRGIAGPDGMATPEDLFIAGDFGTGPSSLIDSIGHAKACARRVDRFLMGEDRFVDGILVTEVDRTTTGRTAEMDALPRERMPEVPIEARALRSEVESGLPPVASQTEASRCYLCNYKFEIDNDLCIYCDRCLRVMPVDDCIVKVSNLIYDGEDRIAGYQRSSSSRDYNLLYLDGDQCIRCGACVEVCPVDCITLQKVSKLTIPSKKATGAKRG